MKIEIDENEFKKIVEDKVAEYVKTTTVQQILTAACTQEVRRAMSIEDLKDVIKEQIKLRINDRVDALQDTIKDTFNILTHQKFDNLMNANTSSYLLKEALVAMCQKGTLPLHSLLNNALKDSPEVKQYVKQQVDKSLVPRVQAIAKNVNDKITSKMVSEFLKNYFKEEEKCLQ